MDSQTIFAALCNAFASLYSEEQSARLVVNDAGLDASPIAFSGRAHINWHNIVAEALRQNGLERLLKIARNDYLDNQDLEEAYAAYYRLLAHGGGIDSPPELSTTANIVQQIATNGAAAITGNVSIGSGDFIGHDQITHYNITYAQITPQTVVDVTLTAAMAKLTELPVDHIPPVATLPPGSHMPFHLNQLFVGRENDLQTLAVALKGDEAVAVGKLLLPPD